MDGNTRGRVRAFVACSVDGFIAGNENDLTWIPSPGDTDDYGHDEFMASIGAILLGRRSFDVVRELGEWPFGPKPVIVATHRDLEPPNTFVRRRQGPIDVLIEEAHQLALGRDVCIEGGELIRAGLNSGKIDELIITLIPTALGEGVALFAGLERRVNFEFKNARACTGGLVQITYVPKENA